MIPTSLTLLANHLWQSTLFAGVAWLLTLVLRKNAARVRHWVWVAASVKFLIPFSLLITLGSHVQWRTVSVTTQTNLSLALDQVSQPFTARAVLSPLSSTVPTVPNRLPAILFEIWACGFVAITFRWLQRWIRVRADVRAASPLPIKIGIPVVSSPVQREPGVFGVFRPVLILPDGMTEQLSKTEWEAILAHELCHARCYDNLTAAIYMLVETIFWFHPLVWWIGRRLVVEREFACDEEVLRLGSEPKVYAEGILKVCELYLESPLKCVAGVTGSNLRRRIQAIMTPQRKERIGHGKETSAGDRQCDGSRGGSLLAIGRRCIEHTHLTSSVTT
jgi:bla regulator protein BlaR1